VLSPDEQLLTRFFRAARLHDTTVMARFSRVDFNPRSDGVVEEFEVTGTAPAAPGGAARTLTVDARVRTPTGASERRTLVLTLERQADRRWLITAIDRRP
jgi:hypothetical protein